jgi:hypothetical protein
MPQSSSFRLRTVWIVCAAAVLASALPASIAPTAAAVDCVTACDDDNATSDEVPAGDESTGLGVPLADLIRAFGDPTLTSKLDLTLSDEELAQTLAERPDHGGTVLRSSATAADLATAYVVAHPVTTQVLSTRVSLKPVFDMADAGSTMQELAGTLLPAFRTAPKEIARFIVPPNQFESFDNIITHESSWNMFAVNPSSGAYGLAQALPASKMISAGIDWPINPVTQLRWAYDYMNKRYGSPNAAWVFWQANHWY